MSINRLRTSARLRAIVTALAAILLVLGIAQPPAPAAAAALATPQDLTPDSVSVDDIPVLSWTRVAGATSYTVEVSRTDDFGSVLWTISTTNHQAVPTKQLPTTVLYWRVRAVSSTSTSAWAVASLERNALAGPTQLGPEDATSLDQPEEPVLLTWTAVTGAKEYTAEVSTDASFADDGLKKTFTQKTTSVVVPNPQVAQTYYWRVRATLDSGIYSQWSDVRSYEIGGLSKPALTGPADGPFTNVTDVVLDWEPVLGAKTYNLQVSTDQNFETLDIDQALITGTAYSPPEGLANDQYYWRVQPVDPQGNKLDWNSVDTWTFRRHWPDQPLPRYPADDQNLVGEPLYFEWEPVPHASGYLLQVSATPTFETGSSVTVGKTTDHTTYTPASKWLPSSATGGSYYWRVIAIDAPGKTIDDDPIVTDAISAEVRHFTYVLGHPVQTAPPSGATVEIPTLAWEPMSGAYSYTVSITALDGGIGTGNYITYGTSFTPRGLLDVGKSYRWDVRMNTESGVAGPSLLAGAQPTFTVAASTLVPAATPEPLVAPAPSSRFPTLTWTPVTGATDYHLWVKAANAVTYTRLADGFEYPAGEDDTTAWFTPGTYDWMVEATVSGQPVYSATTSTFELTALPTVSGRRVGLTGRGVMDPDTSCATALPERCMDLRQTPVLAWDPIPGAALYKVWIARDEQMTNIVDSYPALTENTLFIPTVSLIDSQAGSAFYWVVQPCKSETSCGALTHANRAFNKLSKPVQTLSPAADDVVANEVTFTWRDYLATNQDPTASPSTEPTGVADIDPTVEARQYRIQVSSDANFQSMLENRLVDQTTFTQVTNTYPEGQLYWRVQAVDGSENALAWSAPVHFVKSSPTVTLTEPVSGAHVSGSVPLRWDPIPYAAAYDVEVYRNNDVTGSSVNLVDDGRVQQPAVSWLIPMAVSGSNYTWRVRPVDAKNRAGRWTDLSSPAAKFYVVGDAPVLSDPAADVQVIASDALFTWQPAAGATTYKFERRIVGADRMAETVTTAALAYAPKAGLTDGSWQWRVSALDAGGAVLGSSAWRGFLVDGTAPAVATSKPTGYVKRTANFVVTFTEPVTNVNTKTFRIRVKGSTTNLLAKVTLSADGKKATLNPTANLKAKKAYNLSMTSEVRDLAGNNLPKPYGWKVTAK